MTKNEVFLNDLIIQAKKCLQELNYANQTIKTYRLIWQRFSEFAQHECQQHYSREIAERFLDRYYGISDLGNPKTNFDRTKVRAMKILGAINNSDRIPKKYVSKLRIRPNGFEEIYQVYRLFLVSQNQSKNTITSRLSRIDVFFRYLESKNILHTDRISPKIILDFILYLQQNY